jgi:hypothetical protein
VKTLYNSVFQPTCLIYTYIHWTPLVREPEGRRPLGRPKRRWVDNIKMELREIGWDGTDWIDVAQDRDHGNEPTGSIKCWEVLE